MRSFLESPKFPIDIINSASAKEKQGGGRPPYWEMVFWWTRKPLAGARAVVAGALLPEDIDRERFLKWIYPSYNGKDFDKVPHRDNPKLPPEIQEKLKNVKLLDPFAGFGSIPLEAIRLGVGEVVAVELLPTAYIFLKAVLEYPKLYGDLKVKVAGKEVKELGLEDVAKSFANAERVSDKGVYELPMIVYDVARWGRWVAEKLREDPDIKELYEEDVAVYIGTWEVRCPICGRYTPLVGNWWLARVKGKKYAYMRPKIDGDRVDVDVVEGKTSGAPTPNVRGRPEFARCLLCGANITYIDPETGRVYSSRSEVKSREVKKRLEFYPKHAIKEWNQKLEEYLEGETSLEELKNSRARPRLLVKVKIVGKDLEFEPCNEKDNEKLWKALEKLKQIWGDPDIPTELIPSYDTRRWMAPLYGANKFYMLFNPCQLLTLVKLVKLIREAGKRVEDEKLREGWSKEEVFKYAEAVTTYLALALCKFVYLNSIVNRWDGTWLKIGESMSERGIAMNWNWVDVKPYSEFTGSWIKSFNAILRGLSYLVSAVSGSPSRVRVILDDATVLSKLSNEKFDVIVTDPPYRDDVPYAELSDFYYVWLKRALSDDDLAPRFHADALIYSTQWEAFSINEVSYNKGRLEYFGVKEAGDYYLELMSRAFKKMEEVVKDDGVIVTYFAHSKPKAWIELVEAAWRRDGLRVTAAWNLSTESAQRVTARGKTALGSSIVVVWRKRGNSGSRVAEFSDVYREAVERAEKAKRDALKSGLTSSDLFIATMIGALSAFTSYDKVLRCGRELSARDIVKNSYAIATRVIASASEMVNSPEALFYLVAKAVFRKYARTETQLVLENKPAEPITISSQDVIILSYGFVNESENEEEGVKLFVKADIIRPVEEVRGAKVGHQKTFVLLEPLTPTLDGIKEVAGKRNLDLLKRAAKGRKLNTIDVLHLLEYFAKQGRKEFETVYSELYSRYPNLVREANEVARIISTFVGDPEKDLAEAYLRNLE